MRAKFLIFWLAIICFLTMAAQGNARDCPPPEQPILQQRLTEMFLSSQFFFVRDCVAELAKKVDEEGIGSDDIHFQLAALYNDAMDKILSGRAPTREQAGEVTRHWARYISNAKPEFDASRHKRALVALVRSSSFHDFENFGPEIFKAMERGASKLEPRDMNLLFEIVLRCPSYNATRKSNQSRTLLCSETCTLLAQGIVTQAADGLSRFSNLPELTRAVLRRNTENLDRQVRSCSAR